MDRMLQAASTPSAISYLRDMEPRVELARDWLIAEHMTVPVRPPADTTLNEIVLRRLDAETKPEDTWSALVLAALESPEELAKLLDEGESAAAKGSQRAQPEKPAPQGSEASPREAEHPRIAFLRSITVEGFRGIGQKATLDLTPGPGLTLVVGRNGSGKSSFAEALELLLTGDTYRWENRSKVWKDGWRNLHHPKAAIAAEFALEGEKGACTVAREWEDGPDLDAATTWAQVKGKPRTDAGGARLGDPARRLPSLPLLQRARLDARRGPVEALRRALEGARPRRPGGRADGAPAGAHHARQARRRTPTRSERPSSPSSRPLTDERAARVREALGKKDWGLSDARGHPGRIASTAASPTAPSTS